MILFMRVSTKILWYFRFECVVDLAWISWKLTNNHPHATINCKEHTMTESNVLSSLNDNNRSLWAFRIDPFNDPQHDQVSMQQQRCCIRVELLCSINSGYIQTKPGREKRLVDHPVLRLNCFLRVNLPEQKVQVNRWAVADPGNPSCHVH